MSLNHIIAGTDCPIDVECTNLEVTHDFSMTNKGPKAAVFRPPTFVRFTGTATNGAQTILSSNNVTSVTRTSVGEYTVDFTKDQTTEDFLVSCNCDISVSTGLPVLSVIESTAVDGIGLNFYSITVGIDTDTALADPVSAHVLIMN